MEAKKHIEIALLAGRVAWAALEMQRAQDYGLLRMMFIRLIEETQALESAFPWKSEL